MTNLECHGRLSKGGMYRHLKTLDTPVKQKILQYAPVKQKMYCMYRTAYVHIKIFYVFLPAWIANKRMRLCWYETRVPHLQYPRLWKQDLFNGPNWTNQKIGQPKRVDPPHPEKKQLSWSWPWKKNLGRGSVRQLDLRWTTERHQFFTSAGLIWHKFLGWK